MTKGVASWGWSTVPQRHMGGKVFTYTQAKVIGGGSAINAQIYTRGNALDYDEWRQMGCEGWGYDDVLPYFRKSEDNDTYRQRIPRQGRPAGRVATRRAPADLRGLFRGGRGAGHPAQHGRQRRKTGRRGLLPADPEERAAVLGGDGLSRAEPGAGEPDDQIRCAGARLDVENGRATGVTLTDGTR
jgi:choline dehydrogenase